MAESTSDSFAESKQVLDKEDINRSLKRLAFEIIERNHGLGDVVLLGIPSRGCDICTRIARFMQLQDGYEIPTGVLDITLYRDDLSRQPTRIPGPTTIPPDGIDGKTVVLIDDVLFSGRTIRAALDAIADIGRPKEVQLAVLIDRGHRELPIRADFVGKNLPTSRNETVRVLFSERDGIDSVTICKKD